MHSHNARTQQATVVVVLGVVLVDVLRPVLIMDALLSAHAVPKVVSEVSGPQLWLGQHGKRPVRATSCHCGRTPGCQSSLPINLVMNVGAVNHRSTSPNVSIMTDRILLNTLAYVLYS